MKDQQPEVAAEAAGPRLGGPWLIRDDSYLTSVRKLFAGARTRCLASLVLAGGVPWDDRDLVLDGMLVALTQAMWRGLDARLLVGGVASDAAARQMTDAARKRARVLRIACRTLIVPPKLRAHARIVVADDYLVVGSSGWLEGPVERVRHNVCVTSAPLAAMIVRRFEAQWTAAAG